MGAATDTEIFDHKPTQEEYDTLCENRAWESGHGGYSGTFAEARGALTYVEDQAPMGYNQAYEHLDNTAQKWEPGLAAPFTNEDGKEQWMVLAVCSS